MVFMKHLKFVDPLRNTIITIPQYLEEHFIKLKYPRIPNNFFLDKIYTFYYSFIKRRIFFCFKLVLKSKIFFKDPPKKDYIIFDKTSSNYLEKLFDKNNYFIIQNRLEDIDNIYLSKNILIFCLKNIFKRSLRLSYLIKLIEIISPNKILTMIDNDKDFYLISDFFKNTQIQFLAIQNASRNIDLKKFFENKFVHDYFVIGQYEKEILKNSKDSIFKLHSIGSLRAALAKKFLEKDNYPREEVYDLCVVCEPFFITTGEEYFDDEYEKHVENIYKVAEYSLKYAKKFQKKIILLGKADLGTPSESQLKEAEEKFYKNYIKTEDFKIKFNKKKEFENYKYILRSKVIVGFSSTMLREAFAFDKKILCVDFANIANTEFPSRGICLLKKNNYELFEERLKKIESLNFEKYLNEIESVNSIYQSDVNTLDYLNQHI